MLPVQNTVPSRHPPVVTWALIALNSLVFFFEVSMPAEQLDAFISRFAVVPARYFGDQAGSSIDLLAFATSMFLHGGWFHLLINMWTLWIFGTVVEDRLGPLRYLSFYLLCGVLASVTHAAINAHSTIPVLGASGAIAGVLGCYIRLFPFARLVVIVPVLFLPLFFELPAYLFAALWFTAQLLQGSLGMLSTTPAGGVAWWAHIGGFVAGLVLAPLLYRASGNRPYHADEGVAGFDPSGR